MLLDAKLESFDCIYQVREHSILRSWPIDYDHLSNSPKNVTLSITESQ